MTEYFKRHIVLSIYYPHRYTYLKRVTYEPINKICESVSDASF